MLVRIPLRDNCCRSSTEVRKVSTIRLDVPVGHIADAFIDLT